MKADSRINYTLVKNDPFGDLLIKDDFTALKDRLRYSFKHTQQIKIGDVVRINDHIIKVTNCNEKGDLFEITGEDYES